MEGKVAVIKEGYTLMHEHITIDLSGVKKDLDCRLDCFDETVKEFQQLYEYGVRNILDVTNIGMGRDVDYIRRVEELLASISFFLPVFIKSRFCRSLYIPRRQKNWQGLWKVRF